MAENLNEILLENFGGVVRNNLNLFLDSENENEISIKSYSPYKLMEELPHYLGSNNNDFSIMTLNCQSLNAKIDKIRILIKYLTDNGLKFKCICKKLG